MRDRHLQAGIDAERHLDGAPRPWHSMEKPVNGAPASKKEESEAEAGEEAEGEGAVGKVEVAQGNGAEDFKDLDDLLGYGRFHLFQIWVVQTLVAIIGAIDYFQLIMMTSEPPDWACHDPDVPKCSQVHR